MHIICTRPIQPGYDAFPRWPSHTEEGALSCSVRAALRGPALCPCPLSHPIFGIAEYVHLVFHVQVCMHRCSLLTTCDKAALSCPIAASRQAPRGAVDHPVKFRRNGSRRPGADVHRITPMAVLRWMLRLGGSRKLSQEMARMALSNQRNAFASNWWNSTSLFIG